MTTDNDYKITEKDIEEHNGMGSCGNLEECSLRLESSVCYLVCGYKHPRCPVNVEANQELEKNPEYVERAKRIRELMDRTAKNLEDVRREEEEWRKSHEPTE